MKSSNHRHAALFVLCALPLAAAVAGAAQVDRKVAADAKGEVVISNVAGTIEVRGWDRNEVQVTGQIDDGVERVDVDSTGNGLHTVVKVVLPRGVSNNGEANITVQVPRNSSLDVTAVSADVSSKGVAGAQRLKTVSGELSADIGGMDSEVRSVSGDITVRGTGGSAQLRASSVSGNIDLSNVSGKLDIVTVSGDARAHLGEVSEVRGRTTSGDLEVHARLTSNGRVDVEGVSGEITLNLAAPNGLSADVESFSGDIGGCLAKSVERTSKYGPGMRLNLRSANGAYVRAKTLSGDVTICDR